MIKKIRAAIDKFELDLTGKRVLTEAATGNFVVTPVIAALAGAEEVYAFTKPTSHGTSAEVREQTRQLLDQAKDRKVIRIVEALDEVPLESIDILTNTGHLRPINASLVSRISSRCVIPLMWEPWEYRCADLDLAACKAKGIKVYGTNEEDPRLRTKEYIGYLVLLTLLQHQLTPLSARVLLVGGDKFVLPVKKVLNDNGYQYQCITNYHHLSDSVCSDVIVLLEHERNNLLIDADGMLLDKYPVKDDVLVIHVCGNVTAPNPSVNYFPKKIRPFGYMSMTPDLVDNRVVIDLHTAGFKVAEGMLLANRKEMSGEEYKGFLESNYPALSFDDSQYW